jgi:preprotein translocase subunit SecG
MQTILVFLLVLVAIAIIALVLLQQGKGADIGAAFGSGASNSVFGSQGSGSFLMRLTLILAAVFFIICIVLTRIAVEQNNASVQPNLAAPSTSQSVPANTTVPAVPSSKK